MYESVFHAVDWDDLANDEDCSACDLRKSKGRPTKKRRNHGEKIYNRVNQCSACQGQGHNRRSEICPMFGTRRAVIILNPGIRGLKVW